jgi:hypothetical protein
LIGGIVVSGVVLCTACADLGGLASGGGASGSDGGGGTVEGGAPPDGSSADSGVPPGMDAGDAAVTVLPAKVIRCASSMTACDGRASAECCLTVTGTDSRAARELGTLGAKCQASGAANCGSYVSVGPDFTMKLPQSCARTIDCDMGMVCCAFSLDAAQRLSTELGRIACALPADCASKGRTLCDPTKADDCAATLNCLPETDPVLSKLYTSWCR